MDTEDYDAINILLSKNQDGDVLSNWEEQFLESIADQEILSPKQKEILDKIWKREVLDKF